MSSFDLNTPLDRITVGELFEMLERHFGTSAQRGRSEAAQDAQPKHLLYGIKGIEDFFGVSHRTAQTYKDGILKPAVRQVGRKIVTDADLALQLFTEKHGAND